MDDLDAMLAARASGGASATSAPVDPVDAMLAARASGGISPTTIAQQPQSGNFVDYVMDNVSDAGNGFAHHVGNFLHGTAQLAQHGLAAGANKYFPGSAASDYLNDDVRKTDDWMRNREAEYQANVPDSAGAYVGATGGVIAPFLISGPGTLSSNVAKVGDAVGNVPRMIGEAVGLPRAGAYAGKVTSGAAQGGIYGASTPVLDGDYADQKEKQVELGGLAGGFAPVIGSTASLGNKAYDAFKDVISPFTEQGRNQRIAQFLMGNVSEPAAAVDKLNSYPTYVPGSQPTTSQAIGEGKLLSIERAAKNTDPYGGMFDDLSRRNNELRVKALQDLAGTDGSYASNVTERNNVAGKLYGDARTQGINPEALTPQVQDQISSLMARPSMKSAMSDARSKAAEAGLELNDGTSLDGLHYAKMNLDEQINEAQMKGNSGQVRLLMDTKNKLEDVMNQLSPAYADARSTFAQMSKPINQMEEAQKITNRLVSPNGTAVVPTDSSGVPMLTRANMSAGLKQVDPTVMTPEQMARLQAIHSDVSRADLTNTAQRAVGSNTPQDLTNLDLVNSLLGKTKYLNKIPGISSAAKSMTDSAANDMQKKLAEALLYPNIGAEYLNAAMMKNKNIMEMLLADPASAQLIKNGAQINSSAVNR